MAKIIAICGKICCGKTYYANQIKEKEKAVILSCDELTKDLFDNDLGEKHDEMALRIWSYFKKKSVELVNIGILSSMFTNPNYRRMGIAKELLDRVVSEARNNGCGAVHITASDMGVKLYSAYGFVHNENFMQYKL